MRRHDFDRESGSARLRRAALGVLAIAAMLLGAVTPAGAATPDGVVRVQGSLLGATEGVHGDEEADTGLPGGDGESDPGGDGESEPGSEDTGESGEPGEPGEPGAAGDDGAQPGDEDTPPETATPEADSVQPLQQRNAQDAAPEDVPTGASSQRFPDVPPGAAFYDHIQWLAGAGIAAGMTDGSYAPTNPVTRGAMAAFLKRFDTEVKPPVADYAAFSDVPVGSTFFAPVSWLRDTGLGTGYPNGTYKPGGSVTRGAMAAFLYRAAGSPSYTPPGQATFSDVPVGSTFFKPVEWLNSKQITTGMGDGRFGVNGSVNRATMAAFLWRFERAYFGGSAAASAHQTVATLQQTGATTSSVTITWPAAANATGYTLRWSRSSGRDLPESVKFDAATLSAKVSGLRPGVKYFFSLTPTGSGAAETRVTASTTPLQPVSVATLNVAASKPAASPWVAWGARRSAAWSTVNSRHPDVIGFQEASFNPVNVSTGEPGSGHPEGVASRFYGDVVRGLKSASGTPYRLTNVNPWNCANPWNPGNGAGGRCTFVDQGASLDVRIAYNPDTLTLQRQGSVIVLGNKPANGAPFIGVNGTESERYLAYAEFTQKSTGKKFFFATTHLHPNDVSKRVTQGKNVRAAIAAKNTAQLPVVFVGDLNTNSWEANGATYQQVVQPFGSAGFTNLMGTQPGAFARKNTGLGTVYAGRPNCNSFNGFATQYDLAAVGGSGPKCWHGSYLESQYVGNNIDYIFTKGVSRAPVFETMLKISNSGKVQGQLPSDHVMLRAEILL